jgi:hypothetical protein
MSRCGFTVTGTRTRHDCFMRQLKANGVVIHQTLCKVLNLSSAVGARDRITQYLLEPDSLRVFRQELVMKCPDIHQTLYLTLVPYIQLMGLDQTQVVLPVLDREECVSALWKFFTRLVYERPLLLFPDSLEGDNVLYIQESFKYFVSEQVQPVYTKKIEDCVI